MPIQTSEPLRRLLSELGRDLLKDIPAAEQDAFHRMFSERSDELLGRASGSSGSFQDLLGLGPKGEVPFGDLGYGELKPDFDDAVIEDQLHAASELYYVYQHERMRVFDVVDVLLRLFHEGRMRMQRGPGARALYLIEKHRPLRYTRAHRLAAYRRTFNYGSQAAPANAVVNTHFHRQFVSFIAAIAQYYRDLLIGEVIRGGHLIDQRPFGSQATIQRLGADMRYALDRTTYGNTVALTVEVSQFLKVILDALETPDIRKAFDANNKWDVIEIVSRRHLGGAAELAQRSKLADAGRRILGFAADNPFNTRSFQEFQAQISPFGPIAEEWIAAYRMTSDGRNFRGITDTLRSMLGTAGTAA